MSYRSFCNFAIGFTLTGIVWIMVRLGEIQTAVAHVHACVPSH